MVDGRAQDWQAKRYVHCGVEAGVLEYRQALIVVHGEHRIEVGEYARHEDRVRGHGAEDP